MKDPLIVLKGGRTRQGIVASDLSAENGLVVEPLPAGIIEKINDLLRRFGLHANPLDLVAEISTEIHVAIAEELMQWNNCECHYSHKHQRGERSWLKSIGADIAVDKTYRKKYKEDTLGLLRNHEFELIARTVGVRGKYHQPVIGVYLQTAEKTRRVIGN